jgi:hypothetical protein
MSESKYDVYAQLSNSSSCLNKAKGGEPIFVLQGGDEFAADLVEQWADKLDAAKGGSTPKSVDARAIAAEMRTYTPRKIPG